MATATGWFWRFCFDTLAALLATTTPVCPPMKDDFTLIRGIKYLVTSVVLLTLYFAVSLLVFWIIEPVAWRILYPVLMALHWLFF